MHARHCVSIKIQCGECIQTCSTCLDGRGLVGSGQHGTESNRCEKGGWVVEATEAGRGDEKSLVKVDRHGQRKTSVLQMYVREWSMTIQGRVCR